jgi:hypothetical protein
MRRALVVLIAFVLVLGTMIPAAKAAQSSLPNYEPTDIGSKFYAEPADLPNIEPLPGDEATGTAIAAGTAGVMAVGDQKRFLVLNDLTGGYSYDPAPSLKLAAQNVLRRGWHVPAADQQRFGRALRDDAALSIPALYQH